MNKARQSLTRKLGPLPVWAWATITGVAIFGYRYMKGQYSPAANTANTVTGEVQPVTDPQDVTTLSPGESAYDPNTGALISTAPDQQPAADAPPGSDPITLAPGESVYDPGTGKLLTPGKPTAPAPHKQPHRKPPIKTRKKHTKPAQHSGKKNVAHQPHHSAGKKARGKGSVKGDGSVTGRPRRFTLPHRKPRAHPSPPTHPSAKLHPVTHHTAATEPKLAAHPPTKPAAHRAPHPTVNRPGRVRATPPRTGAMRQRPAATHPAPRGRRHAR